MKLPVSEIVTSEQKKQQSQNQNGVLGSIVTSASGGMEDTSGPEPEPYGLRVRISPRVFRSAVSVETLLFVI